jgi:NADH:ubiquinone oxidoreductase subunit C
VTAALETLQTAFANGDISTPADGIPTVLVPLADLPAAIARVRGELQHSRFVDLTAIDRLTMEGRFELVYLFYSMHEHSWLRLKARTDGSAPSLTPEVPGANWYERELFDLFGIRFDGHPDLTRIMLPEDWRGYPLRRTEPIGAEPVDFTVTREIYGTG